MVDFRGISYVYEKGISYSKMYSKEIEKYAADILESEHFRMTRNHIQHGTMTVYEHCMSVAKTSLWIRDKLGIVCNDRDLVRGALLHDYFLYDWHIGEAKNPLRLHGFFHPGIALKNAKRDFQITERQENIIYRHMWPLTILPPTCREAWLVTCADKFCSLMETFHFQKGQILDRVELQKRV